MLTRVYGRVFQPYGDGSTPVPVGADGTVLFSLDAAGSAGSGLRAPGAIATGLNDGLLCPVELMPGNWLASVRLDTGERFSFRVPVTGVREQVDTGIDVASLVSADEVSARELARGESAYEVAVSEGFSGSRKQWLESLKTGYEGFSVKPYRAGVLVVDGPVVFSPAVGVMEIAAPFTPDTQVAWSVNPHAQRQNRWIDNLSYDEVTNAIYSGYGDWSANGDAVYIVKHDLDTGEAYTVSHRIKSEAVGQVMRHGDWLYAPHIDWNGNYWDGGGYATNEGGFWHDVRLPGQCEHLFFMLSTPDGLWACGSSIHPNQADSGPTIWFRPNSGHVDSREEYPEGVATPAVGEGWQIVYRSEVSGATYYRFYRAHYRDGKVWVKENLGDGARYLGFTPDGAHVEEAADPTGGKLNGRGDSPQVVVDGSLYEGTEYGKILKEKVVG